MCTLPRTGEECSILKSRPYIFLGYGEDEFGYKLWYLIDKKVIQSRDIVFMEEKTIAD